MMYFTPFVDLQLYSKYKHQLKPEFRCPQVSSKALCIWVDYIPTVKNEFLDYIGLQNLSLGVETHYFSSNFFHLVQNKWLQSQVGMDLAKSPSSTLATLPLSLSSVLISENYELLTFSHKLPG